MITTPQATTTTNTTEAARTLGAMGGKANTGAQQAARAKNLRNGGGRPRVNPEPQEYEKSGEWCGFTVRTTPNGWLVDFWSRTTGERTGERYLIKYDKLQSSTNKNAVNYDSTTDLKSDHNEWMTVGEFIAYVVRGSGRCLKRGIVVE